MRIFCPFVHGTVSCKLRYGGAATIKSIFENDGSAAELERVGLLIGRSQVTGKSREKALPRRMVRKVKRGPASEPDCSDSLSVEKTWSTACRKHIKAGRNFRGSSSRTNLLQLERLSIFLTISMRFWNERGNLGRKGSRTGSIAGERVITRVNVWCFEYRILLYVVMIEDAIC